MSPFMDNTPLPPKEVNWKSDCSSFLKYDNGQSHKVFFFFYLPFPSSTSSRPTLLDFYLFFLFIIF